MAETNRTSATDEEKPFAPDASPEEQAVYQDALEEAEAALEDPTKNIDVAKIMDEVAQRNDEIASKKKVPIALRVFGALSLVVGALSVGAGVLIGLGIWDGVRSGALAPYTVTAIVVGAVLYLALFLILVGSVVLGFRLLRNKRRNAARVTWVLIALFVVVLLCDMMLFGIDDDLIFLLVMEGLLIALAAYLDPSLSEERRLERRLREMRTQEQVEDGTLGLDETGKGYISLDFFNLFWIFVVASVLGLIIEVIYHMAVVDPGVYQDRAGMLFGPFSPIYGFGAVLMTIALNHFHKAHIIVVFLVSAVIGGAFEFFVSWFMETAFGAKAWDYTGTFLSIDGRTNGMFMAMWGALGVVWIKLILPQLLKLVNLIPWKMRYTVTTVCAALMIVNGVMTLQSLDCWYERLSGKTPDSPVAEFYDKHFGNDWMANRFQSMTITPGDSSRADK